jgi:hypothetical protein
VKNRKDVLNTSSRERAEEKCHEPDQHATHRATVVPIGERYGA